MSEDQDAPDLLDLKFLPAWLKEAPDKNVYADYAGDEEAPERTRAARSFERRRDDDRRRGPKRPRQQERPRGPRAREDERRSRPPSPRPEEIRQPAPSVPKLAVKVRFLPDGRVMENVLAQI